MRTFPLRKIVGPPWKEGEIRFEVDNVTLNVCTVFFLKGAKASVKWTVKNSL